MGRILLAGDQGLIPEESRAVLVSAGQVLECLGSSHAVISQFLEDPPDLLLVDLHFNGDTSKQLLRSLKSCMQKTNVPIILILKENEVAGVDWQDYPVDDIVIVPFSPEILLARITIGKSRVERVFDNNPLSRLPGNTSIIRAIQNVLDSGAKIGVCYVDIDNFKPYNDCYGFSRGDEVILMVARLIVNAVEENALEGSFVGHVGGDDFVFIVAEEKIDQVCQKIISHFEAVRKMFLSEADLQRGCFVGRDRLGNENSFDLLSISIAVVLTDKSKFAHYGEVSAAASQMKHYVKQFSGSNYKVDRRGKP